MTRDHNDPGRPAIAVDAITQRFGKKQALGGVSMEIAEGEVVGVLGPNGAGKSTLVGCIAGLRRPDTGTVQVAGFDPVSDRKQVRRLLGVQLQRAAFHDALTVRELAKLFAAFVEDPWDVDELLGATGLRKAAKTRSGALSGGQHQRLALALAMIGRPPLLILDELSTGLDPQARVQIWKQIEQLRADGTTIMLVSHSMEEVERLCDRVVLLQDGVISAAGTVPEFIAEQQRRDPAVSTLSDAFLAATGSAPENEDEEKENSW